MNPIFVDDVTIRLFSSMVEPGNPNSGHVEVWTNAGFGRVDPATWGNSVPVSTANSPYVFWSDLDTNTFWICPQPQWQTTNIPQLVLDSWRLMNFLTSYDYTLPAIPKYVTWAKVVESMYVGVGPGATAICLQRQGSTSWEWTVRGDNGLNVWTEVPTLFEAQSAAVVRIRELVLGGG